MSTPAGFRFDSVAHLICQPGSSAQLARHVSFLNLSHILLVTDAGVIQHGLHLPALAARLPQLQAIAHNGGESARAMRVTAALGLPVHRLPSSSPANASWSFDRKLAAWGAVFQQHGLA